MTPPVPRCLRDGWRRASAVDRLNFAFLLVLTAFASVAATRVPRPGATATLYGGFVVYLGAAALLRAGARTTPWRTLALFLHPIAFMIAVYESFLLVLPYFLPARFDALLARADLMLFGVHPTVWMERFQMPWLTDAMFLLYAVYFPMPFAVLLPLYRQRSFVRLERACFGLLVCYYGAYVVCFFVPAEGPRFHLAAAQTRPLDGVMLAAPIYALIDVFEPNKLDAFPSLHASIAATTLLLAWRERRATFWMLLPIGLGILVSLVYCRYHYVVDVTAGLAWAVGAWLLAPRMFRHLAVGAPPHFGAESEHHVEEPA